MVCVLTGSRPLLLTSSSICFGPSQIVGPVAVKMLLQIPMKLVPTDTKKSVLVFQINFISGVNNQIQRISTFLFQGSSLTAHSVKFDELESK